MGRKRIYHYLVPTQIGQEDRISEMLKMLQLDGIAATFTKLTSESLRRKSTFYDFLESLLEKESVRREENRINRWVQQSKIPARKTLDEFDFSFQQSIDQNIVRELGSCRFIERGQNVIFLGPAGVGKTHLSIALGLEAIYKGFEMRFLTLDTLIELVEKADSVELSSKLLRTIMRPRLLILDDIDFYHTGKNASTFLFKLMVGRYQAKLSTIFTSNKEFNEWEELFGSKQRASAALDRLLERADIINITGESYRIKGTVVGKSGISVTL